MGVFSGKRAIVVGASAEVGSGWATAERLAEEGARVMVAARTRAGIDKLAKKIGGIAVKCDVSSESDVIALARIAKEQLGEVDIAIHAAGHPFTGSIDRITAENLEAAFAINFRGPLFFVRHVTRIMPDGGSIVIYTSNSARRVVPGFVAYACAKAAATMLVRYAAIEYAPRQIRVNAVEPGFINSPMSSKVVGIPQIMEVMTREIPLGRAVTPQEVAAAALGFCRADAYMTGTILEVDGGQHLRRPPWPSEMPAEFRDWLK